MKVNTHTVGPFGMYLLGYESQPTRCGLLVRVDLDCPVSTSMGTFGKLKSSPHDYWQIRLMLIAWSILEWDKDHLLRGVHDGFSLDYKVVVYPIEDYLYTSHYRNISSPSQNNVKTSEKVVVINLYHLPPLWENTIFQPDWHAATHVPPN